MPNEPAARTTAPRSVKKPWEPPKLTLMGDVAAIVQDTGVGKLTTTGGDPGENKKESGTQ